MTADEQDALMELFNIGIGRAANSLSEMVNDEVILSIPHISVITRSHAVEMIVERASDHITAIKQQFSGFFGGTALLVYPESNSLELVRTLIGEDTPLETLTELEQESLLEVGNIILNACLGSFANMMELELDFDLPEFFKGNCKSLLFDNHTLVDSLITSSPSESKLVFLILDFMTKGGTKKDHKIKGFVMILLDSKALEDLREKLQRLLS
ncbi:MAG: chemotaxis protein CheC [Magnetococcales bacterium]|nr:chemotaxis protein CheC [Magnetococcales bacterium]